MAIPVPEIEPQHDSHTRLPIPEPTSDLASHEHLMHHIFRYLTNPSLARCLRVNKYFSSLAGPFLYDHVDLSTLQEEPIRELMVGCPPHTKKIMVKPGMKWKPLLLTHIKHLTLRGQHHPRLHDPVVIIKAPNLETLRIQIEWDTARYATFHHHSHPHRACELFQGIQPKTVIFHHGIPTTNIHPPCMHIGSIKGINRIVIVLHPQPILHFVSEQFEDYTYSLIHPIAGSPLKFPAQVDIVFATPCPHQPFVVPGLREVPPFGPIGLIDNFARLPWEYPKTTFRLINADAITHESAWNSEVSIVPGGFAEQLQRGIALDRHASIGSTAEGRRADLEDAMERVKFVSMEDFLRENRWDVMMDREHITGWLDKLSL